MYFDNVAAGIELLECTFSEVKIESNIVDLLPEAERKFGLNVLAPAIIDEKGHVSKIRIKIIVEIEQDGNGKSLFSMIMDGLFKATKEITEDEFIRLVSINGVASMIGIARGKIESISSSIYNNGKVVIPFVNVVEYYKELEKQLKESGAGHH